MRLYNHGMTNPKGGHRLLVSALLIIVLASSTIVHEPHTASAQTADCSKRNPPFPDHPSGEILAYVQPDDREFARVPLRRGFYCVPTAAEGNEAAEYTSGFGFGYDKARHRHNIPDYSAIVFILQAPYAFPSDLGENYIAYARKWSEPIDGSPRELIEEQKVIAATNRAKQAEYFDMPSQDGDSDSVGLLTAYCQFPDPTKLRCQEWVSEALSNGEE